MTDFTPGEKSVLNLHRADERNGEVCVGCSYLADWPVPWPCMTVLAVVYRLVPKRTPASPHDEKEENFE